MKKKLFFAGIVACVASVAAPASAALTLTAAGIADGFSLSKFYSDNRYYGILQATTTSSGKVITTSYDGDSIQLFNDSDGQTIASMLNSVSVASKGQSYGIATVGGHTYFSPGFGGQYYEVNPTTLALTPLTLSTPVIPYLGLWANQTNGHLLSSSYSGIVDINPLTGAVRILGTPGGFDGITVSPDGTKVYGANGSFLLGYDIATGAQVLSANVGRGIDGTGVISGTQFDGYIVANNNDGTVGLINPITGVETIIADSGSRGDFVGPDLTNGSLFLSTADSTWRLAIAGGAIGGPVTPPVGGVPEPSTWAMLLTGFGLAGATLRRRNRALAACSA